MARVTAQVPYALQEAVVQACGTVFWYKRPLKALMVRAGVPPALGQKYEDASKFIIVREIRDTRSQPIGNLELVVPWVNLGVIILVVYAVALAATLAPAIRASRIRPAETLRYQ